MNAHQDLKHMALGMISAIYENEIEIIAKQYWRIPDADVDSDFIDTYADIFKKAIELAIHRNAPSLTRDTMK